METGICADRDGRLAEYRLRPLRKFRNFIPCTTPQSLGVQCSNAAKIGQRKTWTYSESCTGQNSVRGKIPRKCTSPGDGKTSWKVWLVSGGRRRCSNEGKTRNSLKFAGVSQTPETISAVSGPKFTILSGHVEEVLLLNKFFSDCR